VTDFMQATAHFKSRHYSESEGTFIAGTRPYWWNSAACLGDHDFLALTFVSNRRGGSPITLRARPWCADCPSRMPCLDAAIANHERFGAHGGLGPDGVLWVTQIRDGDYRNVLAVFNRYVSLYEGDVDRAEREMAAACRMSVENLRSIGPRKRLRVKADRRVGV